MAVARTAVQPSRDAAGRSCESRRMLSRASGTQLRPATRPRWVTCADMPPAKANENAPRKLARLASRRARRKQNIASPATAQVAIMLSVHAAVPGKMANSQVSGYAAPEFQPVSNGAPLQMYGSNSGKCRPDLVPGQHAQREVLGQVVTGKNGVPEQRGDAEDDRRQPL